MSSNCYLAPGYNESRPGSPDYALCRTEVSVDGTPYFETVNIDEKRLTPNMQLLLTGFGCTERAAAATRVAPFIASAKRSSSICPPTRTAAS